MRLTHLTSVHPRYDTRIFYKQCVYAAQSGIEVTLLVNDLLEDEIKENVRIISTNKALKSKMLRVINSVFRFPLRALKINSDLYVIHDPELIPCGIFLKILSKKIVFDIHEDYFLIHFNQRGLVHKILGYLYKKFSDFFIKSIDGTFVVNDRLYSQYKNISKRILLVPNFPILNKNTFLNSSKRSDNILRLVFAGGINADWNIAMIANAVQNFDQFEFHIIGKPNDYLKSLNLDDFKNVIYHGHYGYYEISQVLSQMDLGLAISSSIQLQGEGSIGNTKVFEYLANGLPVIVNKNDVWEHIIGKNGLGFILDEVNEKTLTDFLFNLHMSKSSLMRMKKAAIELVKLKYNWEEINSYLNLFYAELGND